MKTFLRLLLLLSGLAPALAQVTASSFSTQTITVPADRYTVDFSVFWTCADFPQTSAPGRVELVNSLNQVVAWAGGHVTQSGATGQTSLGSLDVLGSTMTIMSPNLEVADGSFTGRWQLTGLAPGTYTLRFWDFETQPGWVFNSTVWTHTFFQGGSAPPPVNQAPTVVWTLAPAGAAHGASYFIVAHGQDADGNLTEVKVWKNGQPFAFAGGGNGFEGDSGNATDDAGPQTVIFTAQAVDAAGATSPLLTHPVTIGAPLPTPCTLTTGAGAGGAVSPGGIFPAGTSVTVTATPDATHDFTGWSGDAGGNGNPIGVLLDRNKAVQANFSSKQYALTTGATGGGSVTPGGTYPYGSVITLTATPDANSRFTGWAGDASGPSPVTAVAMVAPRSVQAVFALKAAQTLTFPHPGNRAAGSPPFALEATSSAGLPVTYTVLSGPATLTGDQVQLTGPGAVTVQADQPGDAFHLAAPGVTRTFNAVAPVVIKYRTAARTVLHGRALATTTNLVLENP